MTRTTVKPHIPAGAIVGAVPETSTGLAALAAWPLLLAYEIQPNNRDAKPVDTLLQWSMVDCCDLCRRPRLPEPAEGLAGRRWTLCADGVAGDAPAAGKVIPGAGGLRKLRWAAKGHGKRGGARVIYFWWITDERILLLDIYAKGRQEDLAAAEIEKLKRKIAK